MFWSDAWFCWQDDICFCLDLNVAGTSSICCGTGGWYLCILGLIQFPWVNINHAYWVSRMPWTCYPHRNEVIWLYKILQAGYTCPKVSRWFIRWKSGPSTWRWPDCNKCCLTFPCLMPWQWTPRVLNAWNPYVSMMNSHKFSWWTTLCCLKHHEKIGANNETRRHETPRPEVTLVVGLFKTGAKQGSGVQRSRTLW